MHCNKEFLFIYLFVDVHERRPVGWYITKFQPQQEITVHYDLLYDNSSIGTNQENNYINVINYKQVKLPWDSLKFT